MKKTYNKAAFGKAAALSLVVLFGGLTACSQEEPQNKPDESTLEQPPAEKQDKSDKPEKKEAENKPYQKWQEFIQRYGSKPWRRPYF